MYIVLFQSSINKLREGYIGDNITEAADQYKYYTGKGTPSMIIRDGVILAVSTQIAFNNREKECSLITGKGIKI